MEELNQNKTDNTKTSITEKTNEQIPCIFCDSNISRRAKVCASCGRHQTWYINYLEHFSLVIALLMVLLGFLQFKEARKDRLESRDALEHAKDAKKIAEDLKKKNNLAAEKLKEIDNTLLLYIKPTPLPA
ncbi:MAG: hypothetical protein HZA16_03610 [Nitrospirae bacterium]|nr:hypothetical protein [Nitrospirota bacterium]